MLSTYCFCRAPLRTLTRRSWICTSVVDRTKRTLKTTVSQIVVNFIANTHFHNCIEITSTAPFIWFWSAIYISYRDIFSTSFFKTLQYVCFIEVFCYFQLFNPVKSHNQPLQITVNAFSSHPIHFYCLHSKKQKIVFIVAVRICIWF